MKKFLLVLLMLLTMGISGFAQSTTITIGNGTTTSYYAPFGNWWANSWVQVIYPSSAITESGFITSIGFQVSDVPTSAVQFSELHIYMGTSQDSVHASTSSWLPTSELSEVLSVTNMPLPSSTGWMTIDLDDPFPYDGTENLVIVISKKMSSYNSALKFNYTAVTNSALYRGSDSDASYANYPGSNTGTRGSYRPNLQLTISQNSDFCRSVAHLTVSEITSTDATITWTAPEDAYNYILQYKTSNEDWEDDNVFTINLTDTFYTLTGLDPNTQYQVRVANSCSDENSSWKNVSFKTECEAISVSNEPYYEQFEGYASNAFPDCWTRLAGYNSYPYISNASATAHQGTGYFHLYNNNANPIIVALPEFVEDLNTLRLSFWMKPTSATAAYGQVDLGVMSDLSDNTTFTLLKSWTATAIGSTSWAYYEMNLDTLITDETGYLVIRRTIPSSSTSTYAWYFDDVKVMPIPTCEAPTELTFHGATSSSITLKWNPGDVSNFAVYYKEANSEDDYTSVSASLDADSLFILDNLISATEYSVYVASVCSDGSEIYCDPILCATKMVPVDLPYSTDFSEEADRNWLLNNGSCTNYWVMGQIPDTTATALFITNDGTTPNYTMSNAISMVSAAKLFTIGTAPQVRISFDAIIGGESSYDYIKLFFAPETENYSAKAGVVPTSSEYGYNSYSTYAFDFSDYASLSTYTSATTYPYRYNLTGGNIVHIDAIMPNPHANPDENSTAQVVFVWRNDNGGGAQPSAIISNVSIEVPSCHRPEDLVATNVTPHTADITWNGGDATEWTVEYGVHGFNLGSGTTTDVTGTPSTQLTGLTDNTEYDVYVKAICDNEESPNKMITFRTPCSGLTIVPQTWSMDSDLVGTGTYVLPGCWNRILSPATTYGYPYAYNSSTYAHSGSRSLYFSNSYSNSYAVMPGIDASVLNIQDLQVSFFARSTTASSYTSLEVGVMTDPTDTATFILVYSLNPGTSYTTDPFVIPFSNYTGTGSYIAFRNTRTTSASNAFCVDDITLEAIPPCSKARLLTAEASTHEAELSWAATGSTFDLHYKTASEANYTTIQGVTLNDGVYTLSNLTDGTQYSWYIVTNCDDNTTFTSDVATFVTECEAIDSIPQTWNFDDNLYAGTSSYPLPVCWNRISTSTSTLYPYSYNSSTYAHSGSRSLYFYNSYLNSLAIMPAIDNTILNINDLQVSFYGRLSTSNDNVRIVVGVMSDPSADSTFIPVDTIAFTNTQPVDPFVVKFNEYEGEGTYIAFKNISLTGSTVANSIYIDDVTLEESPVCSAPINTVAFPTPNSVNLRWDDMTEGLYNIYYKVDTEEVYISIENVIPTDDYYSVEGLDASTTYNFYIETICDDGSVSATNEYTFTTLCETFTAPFSENFNAANVIPACWEKRMGLVANVFAGSIPQTTTSGWVFNNNYVFGQYHPKLNIYGTNCNYWLISPDIDLSAISTPALTFDLALSDYGNADPIENPTSQEDDKFMVIISTDHGMTWSESNATIWSNAAGAEHVYNQIPNTGQEVIINLEDYAGQTVRIAFYGESTTAGGDNDLHIDNVFVGEAPSCSAPSQIVVDSILAETVYLSWTENGDATSWVVEYGLEGFTLGTGTTVTANTNESFGIAGLMDATTYDVYVRAVCDDNSTSNPTSRTFTTECLPMSLPYSQNFDALSTGSTSPFALCWKRNNTYSTSTNYPYVSSTYSVSGSNSLYFYCSSTTYSMAILPQIDPAVNPINNLQLSFSMRTSSETCKMVVGALTNPLDANTFTPIDTVEVSSTNSFEPKVVTLSSYTGNGSYVALRQLNTSSTNAAYIDDVYLETIPTCPRPSDVISTAATSSSITLSWEDTGAGNSWEIKYGASGFNPETEGTLITPVGTNPYEVTGLSHSTTYDFYVRTICGAGDTSNWSNSSQASTTMVAEALPYQTDFATDQSWLMNNGAAPNYWMMGIPSGATESALFVTNNGTTATYTIGSVSVAMAEKLFIMPTNDSIHVEFDVKIGGEVLSSGTPYDYLKVFLTPATVEFTPGATSSNTQSGYSYSNDAFDFSDYLSQTGCASYPYKLNLTQGNTLHINMNVINPDPNGSAKIVFLWRNDGSGGDGQGATISNFSISAAGSTPVVTDPTVTTTAASDITQTSATLNATITNPDGVTITAKGFEWRATDGGTYTQIAGTGTGNNFTANLTGLTANANYTFRAFITFNGTTVTGDEMTFTTYEEPVDPCDAPTNLQVNSITQTSATMTWTAGGTETSWKVGYNLSSASQWQEATVQTTSYNIEGLTANSTYDVRVKAICAADNESDFITSSFTTTGVGIDNITLSNSISLMPNPADNYIDLTVNSNVEVKEAVVYNAFGQMIQKVELNNNHTRIDLSDMAAGMYFVRVNSDNVSATKKFIKR